MPTRQAWFRAPKYWLGLHCVLLPLQLLLKAIGNHLLQPCSTGADITALNLAPLLTMEADQDTLFSIDCNAAQVWQQPLYSANQALYALPQQLQAGLRVHVGLMSKASCTPFVDPVLKYGDSFGHEQGLGQSHLVEAVIERLLCDCRCLALAELLCSCGLWRQPPLHAVTRFRGSCRNVGMVW
jgi:hypothetical protein